MSVLVEGLNTSLVSCAKLRSRRWCLWEDMGQWNQEEFVISGLIHNLPSRLYIDPIQSGETLNVNWFVWDTYEFYGLSKFGETWVASKIQSIILILMLAKCQLIWNCHVLVWLYNSNGCLPTYRFSEFSTLGETQATNLTPRRLILLSKFSFPTMNNSIWHRYQTTDGLFKGDILLNIPFLKIYALLGGGKFVWKATLDPKARLSKTWHLLFHLCELPFDVKRASTSSQFLILSSINPEGS